MSDESFILLLLGHSTMKIYSSGVKEVHAYLNRAATSTPRLSIFSIAFREGSVRTIRFRLHKANMAAHPHHNG
jgi:hypothetical protein